MSFELGARSIKRHTRDVRQMLLHCKYFSRTADGNLIMITENIDWTNTAVCASPPPKHLLSLTSLKGDCKGSKSKACYR